MNAPQAEGKYHHLKTLRTLLPYLWPRGELEMKARVVVAMIFLVAAKGITVSIPIFYKFAVDALTDKTTALITIPVGLLIAYGLARIMGQAFGELRDAVFAKVAQRAIRQAGLRTFRHLHRLGLRFHMDRQTGGLSRAVERGTKGIDFLLNFTLFNIAPTMIEILLVCGVMWGLFNFYFALVTFVVVGIFIFWTVAVTEWRTKYRRRMNKTDSEANTKAIDSLLNYETVKYFGNEEHEARRFDAALQAYEVAAVKSKTTLATLNIGQGVVISVGVVLVMIMAASGVVEGRLTIGDFVLVNSYLIQLFMPLGFLGFVYREIKQSLTDMEDMFTLLDREIEVDDALEAPALEVSGGRVQFENVDFHYEPNRRILHGINFTIEPGRKVAVVGSSGAGKSTLSRLLYRFYDVTGGRILIDGQDIREVGQDSLRAAIGIVPQDTVLFNDSIFYNISYGRPGATPTEIEDAARHAAIHDFVQSLPDGYNTKVGERGLKLSGGEKQRVAIARTILKGPRIMLFDEATSALDTRTEKGIQQSLSQMAAEHTTLVIAHRLSTVKQADRVLVLDEGRIVQEGTHAELVGQEGLYRQLVKRQFAAA